MDIFETVRKYMSWGCSLDVAIHNAEIILRTEFSEDMKARIRTEINFTPDLKKELADKKAMEETYR